MLVPNLSGEDLSTRVLIGRCVGSSVFTQDLSAASRNSSTGIESCDLHGIAIDQLVGVSIRFSARSRQISQTGLSVFGITLPVQFVGRLYEDGIA